MSMIKILGNTVERLKELSFCLSNGTWVTWLDSVVLQWR